ncbi:glycosyltransferase [Bacteroides faecichinchillae]|uniref:glycosyltransferase family 2 protein n=1 Tax=Bacteroides faecichinchillae TaxID=871325 RepID=UPI003514D47B
MENRQVEVSVIIPNYNYARFLRQRIESVLSQTYTNFEIILLDDASTDDSVSILNDYRDNKHVSHVEINTKNTGSPFMQWKKGIRMARGKYIWIAESDDAAEPIFLEKAVAALNQYPEASFCFIGAHCINEFGKPICKDFDKWTSKQLRHSSGMAVFEGTDYIEHNLYWRNYIYNASGAVFQKSCFEQIKGSPCFTMRYCGDWLFWIEMARQGMVIEIYDKLNFFRIHSSSTIANANVLGQGVKEAMQIVSETEKQLPLMPKCKKRIIHGSFYKEIKRMRVSANIREELLVSYRELLQGSQLDYYIERFYKLMAPCLPGLLTRIRDRL